MQMWPPSSHRPPDFPEGLPFVPGIEVGIEVGEGGRTADLDEGGAVPAGSVVVMKWWAVERPLEVLQQLLGASVRDGWTVHDDAPPATGDTGSIRRIAFRQGDRERVVEAVQAARFSFVTLTERDAQ